MLISQRQMRGMISVLDNPKEDNFERLVQLAGLDPSLDFRKADLRFVDFGTMDLSGYDFSGALLSGANLSRARGLDHIAFDGSTHWPEEWQALFPNWNEIRTHIISGSEFKREWMTSITALNFFGDRKLSTLRPLLGFVSLRVLDVTGTMIDNIDLLSGLTRLQELYLASLPLNDISSISSLSSLRILDLSRTQVADLSPLADLKFLHTLNLRNTPVCNVAPLLKIDSLEYVDLVGTKVRDTSLLRRNERLRIVLHDQT